MKQIIYNRDNLSDNDITETVIRTKALVINQGTLLIGNANNVFQFPGGHLEENETLEECLKREVLEEMGIEIDINNIAQPFMEVIYCNKNWPSQGKNRKAVIYYYAIETEQKPDLSKTKYTENELKHNFKIEELPLNDAVRIIENNIPNNEENKVISPDMIKAINEYFNNK